MNPKSTSVFSKSHLHPLIVNPLTFVIGIIDNVFPIFSIIFILFLSKKISWVFDNILELIFDGICLSNNILHKVWSILVVDKAYI